ncbi:4-hydroxyphenylacetate 3-hydroxylase N-terminal domain-containing protein [Zavarzinia sp. CC-PAN008]|uniref:4-hydroxyphenylacetate 3-hydroxylase N-terminal domain-containing protein n=1 Tax=Zavarzinia sp. CC-PAN008 TaxID=3243332 RepID=UPI003F745358
MGLKTKEQYRQSLNDGRVIFWGGEKITDVMNHPRFRVPIEVAARDYDYDAPGMRDIRTYETEDGTLAHRVFQVPRTADDLTKRVQMSANMSIVGGVTGVYMALLQIKGKLAEVNPQFAENIERMYKYARDNDLRGAECITDAKGDRSRKAHEQDDPDLYVRVVDRNKDGIVVRGAKLHISAAALCHELVIMPTKSMRQDEADYALAFAVPTNAPGLKIVNRNFAPPNLDPFDYPSSAHHSMPEGFVIFDDVFVPWDRVFLCGESQLSGAFAGSLGLWERTGGVIAAAEQSKVMVGLAQLVAEQQGKERDPHIQDMIAELICYAETIRMGLEYAIQNYETTSTGMVHPNTLGINVAKYYYASNYHLMVRNLQDIAGGLTVTLPEDADFRNPESGAYLRKYMHAKPGVDIDQRRRIYSLIRDSTADAYGGWHLVTALQAGGGLKAQRIVMSRTYDMKDAKHAALKAAGALPDEGHATAKAAE